MPLSYDQISAITEKKFIPKLVDNIFDSDPLVQRARKKFQQLVDGGTKVVIPLNYAQTAASDWYQGADTLNTTDNEVITAAEYEWKQLYANITISRRDRLINSGDAQIINFVKSKTQIAEKTIKDKLGDAFYNDGTVAKAFGGLRLILSTNQVVGGISQATYSWWQAQVDSSTTTLSIAALQTLDTSTTINDEGVTVWLATRANYNRFYALLQPQQRFADSDTAKGGFTSLMFNGKPFIAGSKVPTNNIIGLNENYLHFIVHKDENMRYEPLAKPVNQNIEVGKIYFMGAFGSSNNRMHCRMTAVAS